MRELGAVAHQPASAGGPRLAVSQDWIAIRRVPAPALSSVARLARGQADGWLAVLPDCTATRIVHDASRAVGVECRSAAREVLLRGRAVVVAAGAVGSSALISRSGIARDQAGRAVALWLYASLTARFPDALGPDGRALQAFVDPEAGTVMEVGLRSIGHQVRVLPGTLEDRRRFIEDYPRLLGVRVMIASSAHARVRLARAGPQIEYRPSAHDLRRLVAGLKVAGEALFQAGAAQVVPGTLGPFETYETPRHLARLDALVDDPANGLMLASDQPHSGNPVGEPSNGGVVDTDMRVHGFENLYVADASALPPGVAPYLQLSTMALARMVAERMTG